MNEKNSDLVKQSIELELNVADLYLFFFKTFDEDKDFWWQLVIEEQNHAALIQGASSTIMNNAAFPDDFFESNIDALKNANSAIKAKIAAFADNPPTRQEALSLALHLEEAAGEAHFQEQMSKYSDNSYIQIFQQLNKEDVDHAYRIRKYMESIDLEIQA